ncbi:hypothetical protein GCM10028805_22550 [Spirosoma harenae]
MLTALLLQKLRPMIGFRANVFDPADATDYKLTNPLKATSSGVTQDQCHELLQIPTLYQTYPNKLADFGAYLAQTRDDAIRTMLATLETRLAEVGLASLLLNPVTLFKGIPTAPSVIAKSGRTVGLMIAAIQRDVTVTIDRLLFSGSAASEFSLKLICVETGIETVVDSITPNDWQDSGLQLRSGYSYYLVYNENDLGDSNQAKNSFTYWPKPAKGCKGCAKGCLTNYVNIKAIVLTDGIPTAVTDTNFGLNLVLSASGDLSGRFVDNPMRLLPLFRQQMAMTFLEKIAYSVRKNPDTEDARQGSLFALTDKDNANRVPLLFESAIKSIVKSMQDEASRAIDVNQDDEISWGSI